MEPLSALGIVAAGVQFVDFTAKLFSSISEIYLSSLGQTERGSLLATLTTTLNSLTTQIEEKAAALGVDAPPGSADALFLDCCRQCKNVSTELSDVLANLTARTSPKFGTRSMRSSLAGGIRWLMSDSKITRLADKLQRIQQQMQMAAILCMWEKANENGETTQQVSQRLADVVTTLEHVDTATKNTAACLRDVVTLEAPYSVDVSNVVRALMTSKWPLHPDYERPSSGQFAHRAQLVLMESLGFTAMHDREATIPKAYAETFEWLFKTRQELGHASRWFDFPAWLEDDSQEIYWITAKPGAGKSTLMKYLTHDPRLKQHLSVWAGSEELIVASFYFWNAGTDLQKSHEGLLRCLLLQCLGQRPDLASRVCQRRWACLQMLGLNSKRHFPDWTWAELVESVNDLVSQAGNGYRLAFFIDGLDEFDGDHTKLVDIIKDLTQWKGVKVCVSSRPWNVFNDAFHRSPSLTVQDLTSNDMQRYVRGHFEDLPAFTELQSANPDTASTLLESIASRADGVFLWVAVVVRTLVERLSAGDSLGDLFATLNQLPRDVEDLFETIRRQIDPQYLSQSSQYFLLLLEARRKPCAFNPSAITLLLADEDEGSLFHRQFSQMWETKRAWMLATMRRRLHSRTMGLLEISPSGTVGFLHRTVLEWVTQHENLANVLRDAPEGFNPSLELCKARTTELLNFHIDLEFEALSESPTPHGRLLPSSDSSSTSDKPERFWRLFLLCLRHAAHAADWSSSIKDDTRLVGMLETLQTQLPALIQAEGFNHFQLDVLFTMVDMDSLFGAAWDPSSLGALLKDLANNRDWTAAPPIFVRLAAKFGIVPFVVAKVDQRVLRDPSGSFPVYDLLKDAMGMLGTQNVTFGAHSRERDKNMDDISVWDGRVSEIVPPLGRSRVELIKYLLRVAPNNRTKRLGLRRLVHVDLLRPLDKFRVRMRDEESLKGIEKILRKELSTPMWLWRHFVKGPKGATQTDRGGKGPSQSGGFLFLTEAEHNSSRFWDEYYYRQTIGDDDI